jgi:uncharacterized protein YjbI with pentapeptide repeats
MLFTDFTDANMKGANLESAYLSEATLIRTDLRNAPFVNADLRDALLIDVNLRGANLRGADLRDVNLADADTDLANVYYDQTTCWPKDFTPPQTGSSRWFGSLPGVDGGSNSSAVAAGHVLTRGGAFAARSFPGFTSTIEQATVQTVNPHHQRDHSRNDDQADNKNQNGRHDV